MGGRHNQDQGGRDAKLLGGRVGQAPLRRRQAGRGQTVGRTQAGLLLRCSTQLGALPTWLFIDWRWRWPRWKDGGVQQHPLRPLRAVLSPRLLLSTHDRPRVVGGRAAHGRPVFQLQASRIYPSGCSLAARLVRGQKCWATAIGTPTRIPTQGGGNGEPTADWRIACSGRSVTLSTLTDAVGGPSAVDNASLCLGLMTTGPASGPSQTASRGTREAGGCEPVLRACDVRKTRVPFSACEMVRPIAGRIAMPNNIASPDRMLSVRRPTPPSSLCEPQRGLAHTVLRSSLYYVGVEGRGLPEGRANQRPSSVFQVWRTAPSIAAQTTASQPGPLDWVRTDGRVIPAERLALLVSALGRP